MDISLDNISTQSHQALKLAHARAMKAMLDNPSRENIRAHEAARLALEKYEREQSAPDAPTLASPRAVHQHLAALGYRRGQSTVYADAKAGLLRPTGQGGAYTLDDVDRYIKAARLQLPGAADASTNAAKKQKEELELLHHRARMAKLRADEKEGSLIPRAQVESDLADRARLLRAGLRNWAHREIDALISLVRGDAKQAPQALAYIESSIEAELDRYAQAGRITLEIPQQ